MLISKFIQRNTEELSLRIELAVADEQVRHIQAKGEITVDWTKRGLASSTGHWASLLTEGLRHASQLTKLALDELFAIARADRLKIPNENVSAILGFAFSQFDKPAHEISEELVRKASERGMGRTWHAGTMKPRIDVTHHPFAMIGGGRGGSFSVAR